jgi:hypothetical protein
MKVIKHGIVILSEGDVHVEGWLVEREADDPEDATNEQLLLGFAVNWAQERFNAALNNASMDVLRALVKRKIEAQRAPSEKDLKLAGHVQYYGQVGTNPNPCTCVYCAAEQSN